MFISWKGKSQINTFPKSTDPLICNIHIGSHGLCFLHFGKPTDDVPLDQAIDKIVENLGNLQLKPAAADEENADSADAKPKSPTSDVTPLKLKIEVVQRAPLDAVAASGAVADAVAEVVAAATPEARIQSIEVSAV